MYFLININEQFLILLPTENCYTKCTKQKWRFASDILTHQVTLVFENVPVDKVLRMTDSSSLQEVEEHIKQNFGKHTVRSTWSISKKDFLRFLQEYQEIVKSLPKSVLEDSYENEDESDSTFPKENADEKSPPKTTFAKAERVKKIEQLQEKLKSYKGKSLTQSGYLERKGLKNRLKKKLKKEERMKTKIKNKPSVKNKEHKFDRKINVSEEKRKRENTNGDIVYSKFDFPNCTDENLKKKKGPVDPFRRLQKVEKSNKKLREMEERGRVEKVKEIKGRIAWNVAIQKAEGLKVKDDVELLKKSVRKIRNAKNRSKKKWEERENSKVQNMEEAQKKRKMNLLNKKKEKKKKKMKKLIKKGRVVQ
ncbi:surfeit locus protein 6 [Rhodnius prolixus]